jgi:hypothetical protein
MFRKVLLYGLPVYLYGLELLLKAVAAIGSESLLGPTMAGAGIGFLLPLTDLKPVSVPATLMKELKDHKASIYSERDKVLVDFVWVTFFLSLAAWMYSVFLSFPTHHASYSWIPAAIGCAVFLISLVLSEIKERI